MKPLLIAINSLNSAATEGLLDFQNPIRKFYLAFDRKASHSADNKRLYEMTIGGTTGLKDQVLAFLNNVLKAVITSNKLTDRSSRLPETRFGDLNRNQTFRDSTNNISRAKAQRQINLAIVCHGDFAEEVVVLTRDLKIRGFETSFLAVFNTAEANFSLQNRVVGSVKFVHHAARWLRPLPGMGTVATNHFGRVTSRTPISYDNLYRLKRDNRPNQPYSVAETDTAIDQFGQFSIHRIGAERISTAELTGSVAMPHLYSSQEIEALYEETLAVAKAKGVPVRGTGITDFGSYTSNEKGTLLPHRNTVDTYRQLEEDDPIRNTDTAKTGWYQSAVTNYYEWYDDGQIRDAHRYIGRKGEFLGDIEPHFAEVVRVYLRAGIYTNGFSVNITSPSKGALLPIRKYEGQSNFFDEYIDGTGPQVSVCMSNHPYTQTLMEVEKEQLHQRYKDIEQSKTAVEGRMTGIKVPFGLKGLLTSTTLAEQFIGTYRLDIYTDDNRTHYIYMISDSKSRKSFLLRMPVNNPNRPDNNRAPRQTNQAQWGSNTMQFYIWKTPIGQ